MDKRAVRVGMGLCVAAMVALDLAGSMAAWTRVSPMTPDSCCYVTGAVSMADGHGYRGLMGESQTLFPPGYPAAILIGFKAVHDGVLAGRAVSVLASALTVIPLMLLAWRLFGVRTSVFAGLFYAILPLRLQISNMVWSESLYLLLLMTGVWLWLLETERPSVTGSTASGLLFGAAYLTRPEGLLSASVLWLLTIPVHRRWTVVRWRSAVLFALAAMVLALPYVIFLHKHTGKWSLTSKTGMNLKTAILRSYDQPWELLKQVDASGKPAELHETRREFARRYLHNLDVEARELQGIVGMLLLAVVVLGVCAELVRRDARLAVALPSLAALALPLAYLPVFFIEPRLVYPASVAVIVFGVWQVAKRFSVEGPGRPAVLLPMLVIAAVSFLRPDAQILHGPRADDSQARIGAWLSSHVEPGRYIMSNDQVAAFYADRRRYELPYAGLDATIAQARDLRAGYIVLSNYDYLTPEMSEVLNGRRTDARLQFVGEWNGPDERRVVLFRLLPERSETRGTR